VDREDKGDGCAAYDLEEEEPEPLWAPDQNQTRWLGYFPFGHVKNICPFYAWQFLIRAIVCLTSLKLTGTYEPIRTPNLDLYSEPAAKYDRMLRSSLASS